MRINVVFVAMVWVAMIWVAIFGLGSSGAVQAASLNVTYPHPPSIVDNRASYAVNVIKLTLAKTEDDFGPWSVTYSPRPLERPASEAVVKEGEVAQVIMLPGTNQHDEDFRLIPFPIDKGLIGYRISLVNSQKRNLLSDAASISDLKDFEPCLMETWNITRLFEFNGLNVNKTKRFEDLFRLVDEGKCDYFSRGVGEILGEFGYWSQSYPNIAIEPHIMMRAPLAFYLYVNKSHEDLAKRIELGMKRAILDGSFDQLFQSEFTESIRSLRLLGRTVINLTPLEVHDNAPIEDKGLWFKP